MENLEGRTPAAAEAAVFPLGWPRASEAPPLALWRWVQAWRCVGTWPRAVALAAWLACVGYGARMADKGGRVVGARPAFA
jgi:hypothetical protein